MIRKFHLLLFIIVTLSSEAYSQPGSALKDSVASQAKTMAQAFLKKDYKTFASFMYSTMIKAMGGIDKAPDALYKSVSGLMSEGFSFEEISFGSVSDIVTNKGELQCTIPQFMKMKTPNGVVDNLRTLLAVSSDNGLHWKFIDTSKKSRETIKEFVPNLSDAIDLQH